MHGLRSLSLASVAMMSLCRCSDRPNSTRGGRPPAPPNRQTVPNRQTASNRQTVPPSPPNKPSATLNNPSAPPNRQAAPPSPNRPPAPLGARILTNPDDIFQHNMWDHVQWSDEDKRQARQKADENSSMRIPVEEQGKYDTDACRYWDNFYEMHQSKFFKDRKWLFLEFPELFPMWPDRDTHRKPQDASTGMCHDPETSESQPSCYQDGTITTTEPAKNTTNSFPGQHATLRIFEAGCGAGNSVFPIVREIKGTGTFLYCCDFSPHAIQLVKEHPVYDQSVCHAFIHDICEEEGTATFPFPAQSLDVILLVFVLSSIHPDRVQGVVNRLSGFLKPGGIFLFRDHGRYDLAQLRFKKGQCLSENFYTRGDGTCIYFFTKDEVRCLFSTAGLEEIQNLEDRRLQVNRGKKVVMNRVWMQSKFRKPQPPS